MQCVSNYEWGKHDSMCLHLIDSDNNDRNISFFFVLTTTERQRPRNRIVHVGVFRVQDNSISMMVNYDIVLSVRSEDVCHANISCGRIIICVLHVGDELV